MVQNDITRQILLKNVNFLDVENDVVRNNMDVLIEDDLIKEVSKICHIGEEMPLEMDCSGKFALPGLFECHAHLAALTLNPDEIKKQILKEFVVKGILHIRDVGGPVKTLKLMKDNISNGEFVGPVIFYAGPMLEKSPLTWEEHNKILPGMTIAVNSNQDAKNIIQEISREGASLVKTFGKFDTDVFKYLLGEAKEHNLPVTHDPGPTFFHSIPMDTGIDLGMHCFEHGKAPWPVVLKDDLKAEHDNLINKGTDEKEKQAFTERILSLGIESISLSKLRKLIDKMLNHNVYFCPTLHAIKYIMMEEQKSKEPKKNELEKLKIQDEINIFFTKEMIRENVKILVGQDGVMPEFTFDEMLLLKEVGLSELEIVKGATIYPAQWLGIADQLGSISTNKKANILILNKNPLEDIQNIKTTHLVLQNGKIVFQE